MCFGQPVQPPTQKSARFVFALKIIAVFQIIISVLNFISVVFIREGILGLFMALLLFMSYRQLSYSYLTSYTFISIFFCITFLVFVMTIVQRETKVEKLGQSQQYIFADACVTCGFYLFTSIFSFFPYKQFKAIQYASNPSYIQYLNQMRNAQQERPQADDPYNLDYGQNNRNQENIQANHNKKQQQTFQAFQGQGIRIG